ncbi:E3 ubiquitin-protein ligase RAD18 [Aspergillus fischeri NRRL 181]|uniref:Postreplication repair E3 ubiquitin-protein ligase RAD18 n=1 Tax=Neosartorya fischeri (strain ATCC 1020 / DSM 3700 / CBS 544.65 / FGSC A1164 / JCM 1740 / NRRL 181 / WB 181) TaxID=331117 RepID=A1DIN3_NEOFI|nr:DNA repair protein (RadR), putative [Aspergillus fischeri NRRL 181]EAW19240.1 DNA repair protein (RadR), putative [Aspergillus fischeri NRRL 181]
MEQTFDLPDSTDWLETPLSLVSPLESSLRCQVCKDFFDNPVITSCSHTFCSLCIRRCLSTEGKCPACRSSDQELKLRRNWAVQELVEAFQNARPSMLELARKAANSRLDGEYATGQPAAKKRKVDQEDGPDASGPEGIRTRSQSRRGNSQAEPVVVDAIEDDQDEEYIPEDGLVACPICGRRMKNEAVFQHLDICTGDPAPLKQASFGSLQPMSPASRKSKDVTDKPPERLPTINYSLLKDNVLRKKLKDLGIPNWGPRPLLQRRHTEWMNLWNANCDSKAPKSKRELLHELAVWERTQGGHAAPSSESSNTVMRKDFDAAAWSNNHGDEFKRLIANARKRKDAVIRTTIPQAAPAQDGISMASAPEQSTETSTPPEVAERLQTQTVAEGTSVATIAENETQTIQTPSITQVVSSSPE